MARIYTIPELAKIMACPHVEVEEGVVDVRNTSHVFWQLLEGTDIGSLYRDATCCDRL